MKHSIITLATLLLLLALSCAGTDGDPTAQQPNNDPGGRIYSMQCTLCHGKDGKLGLSGAKDLTVSQLSREEMIAVVTKGRNAMAGYGRILKATEIEQVVDHVRSLHAVE